MNVALHVRRVAPDPAAGPPPAEALWLPGADAAGVLAACDRLGLDPQGRAFALARGRLIVLDRPEAGPVPGAVRLRRRAENLFVPVDAELVPDLLDDEAAGLTRKAGLVFLPGAILAFRPERPLGPAELLAPSAPAARRSWAPPPDPPRPADRIEELTYEGPEAPSGGPVDPLADAGGAIGTVDPTADDPASPRARLSDRARLAAGRGMLGLGRALGIKGLAAAGAGWMAEAMAQAPRLGRDVIGKQAAALRSLLQDFRKGDLDRALSRALPLDPPAEGGPPRGSGYASGLPTNDLTYSLRNLLGGGWARGPASLWLADYDVMAELAREYRKAAEDAERKGDARRAAYIYARLLRDDRQAANCLLRGGLAHDAAMILLHRLHDLPGAARAFEAAGEVDAALQLYRQLGDHEAAGDLLRRAGEEEAALAEYRIAAMRLARSGEAFLRAGDLLAEKAGRPDLALPYYAVGWSRRPEANALACARKLARHHAGAGDDRALRELADEAESHFAARPNASAAVAFFDELAGLADAPALAGARDDLRDLCLRSTASALRAAIGAEGRPAGLGFDLLALASSWPRPVVSDAEFAVRAAARRAAPPPAPAPPARAPGPLKLGRGPVTAASAAIDTGEVFVGFRSGEVVCYRPGRDEVIGVVEAGYPISALSVSADGSFGVLIRAVPSGLDKLTSFGREPDGTFQTAAHRVPYGARDAWLTTVARAGGDPVVGVSRRGETIELLRGPMLSNRGRLALLADALAVPLHDLPTPDPDDPAEAWRSGVGEAVSAAGLVDDLPDWPASFGILACVSGQWCLVDPDGTRWLWAPLHWRPAPPREGCSSPSWAARRFGSEGLTLTGLDAEGRPHWASLRVHRGRRLDVASQFGPADPGRSYLASCPVAPGMLAAVGRSGVDWLTRGAGRKLVVAASTPVDLPRALAAFESPETRDLVVVDSDGAAHRVAIPLPTHPTPTPHPTP